MEEKEEESGGVIQAEECIGDPSAATMASSKHREENSSARNAAMRFLSALENSFVAPSGGRAWSLFCFGCLRIRILPTPTRTRSVCVHASGGRIFGAFHTTITHP